MKVKNNVKNDLKNTGWLLSSLIAVLTSSALVGCNGGSNSTNTTTSVTPPPVVTPSPPTQSALSSAFPLHTQVFGIMIRATADTATAQTLHAANIMAQYLDNDENGIPDNQAVVDKMVEQGATLLMASDSNAFAAATQNLPPSNAYQDLLGDEIKPNGAQNGEFDATLEEVLHLITHVGYASVYPQIFAETPDSAIADAMDIARGGRFETIPTRYPATAWYTYDDETCDYSCMVTEYTYWSLTSILGAQDFSGRPEAISHEWKLSSKDKVAQQDPAVYAILTNAIYGLATQLPDGNYTAAEFFIEGGQANANGTSGSNSGNNEILLSAQAANSGYKIAYGDTSKIWMMNPDGSEVTELADGSPISG